MSLAQRPSSQRPECAAHRCAAAARRCSPTARTQRRPQPACAAAPEGGAGRPPPPDIALLSQMARLEVSAQEAAAWTPRINAIVDWFGQLRQVELDGVQPSPRGNEAGVASAVQLEARLRPDEPRSFPHAQELMDAASNREGPFFRIPKILEDTS